MTDDRLAQARAEAARRWPLRNGDDPIDLDGHLSHSLFLLGVEWADANPYSTPEALVAAYEEGQRDAVSKGLANPQRRTITLAQSEAILEAGRSGRYEDHEAALRAAGIEVVDDE